MPPPPARPPLQPVPLSPGASRPSARDRPAAHVRDPGRRPPMPPDPDRPSPPRLPTNRPAMPLPPWSGPTRWHRPHRRHPLPPWCHAPSRPRGTTFPWHRPPAGCDAPVPRGRQAPKNRSVLNRTPVRAWTRSSGPRRTNPVDDQRRPTTTRRSPTGVRPRGPQRRRRRRWRSRPGSAPSPRGGST